MKTGVSRIFSWTLFALNIYVAPLTATYAQIVTGAPAIDGIGQYNQTSFTAPVFQFDKSGSGDSPNKLGFDGPTGIAVDQVNHRLFVSDTQANRILVFGLTANDRINSRFPQNVLGQIDYASSASGNGSNKLSTPQHLAYSPSRNLLFVADFGNNRVLVYDVSSIVDGEAAVNVLGQPDFTTTTAAVAANKLSSPHGLALDDTGGRLFVTCSGGSRVLVFNISPTITNGQNADKVLGKANFTDNTNPFSATDQNLRLPRGLAYDATHGRLFVADPIFNRITVFDVNTIINNENATHVICQSNFTSIGSGVTASTCNAPTGVAYEGVNDTLYIGDAVNSRVSVYLFADPGNITNGMAASAFLGQVNSTTSAGATSQTRVNGPRQVGLADGTSVLYVADSSNRRVVSFDVLPATTHEPALDMLGQYDETSYSSPVVNFTKSGQFNSPNLFGIAPIANMAIDSVRRRLFITDGSNNRVLVYQLNDQNELLSKVPVAVLGQLNFGSEAVATTQNGMSAPDGVAYDSVNDRLFVSDSSNNRVLVFNTSSVATGQNAAFVLGQPNFTTSASNLSQSGLGTPRGLAIDEANQRLFVGDNANGRVLVFDITSISNGESAIAVLGQADFTSASLVASQTRLAAVRGLTFDAAGQRLFVADDSTHRVLAFDVASISNGEAATGVLCQSSFTASGTGTTDSKCHTPQGLAYHPSLKVLYVSDFLNNRVLAFDAASISDGEAATRVLGQSDFTTSTYETTAYKVSPSGIMVDETSHRLYVNDLFGSRILLFPTRYAFTYSGTSFSESAANNGTVSTSVTITVEGDQFSIWSGTLTRGVHYSITGVPAGLTEVLTMTASNSVTLSFTGAAAAHASANNVSAITLTFLDAALQTVPASGIEGASKSFSMTFSDAAKCFGGALPSPRIKVSGKNASVTLPTGIVPSSECTIKATATLQKPKKTKTASYRTGKQLAQLTKLSSGRWSFAYVVTTTALGTAQTSAAKVVKIR